MPRVKVQSGNPNRLTVHQHAFPAASLARFVGDDGLLEVLLTQERRLLQLNPRDPLFCAYRAWDEPTERNFMKHLEDNFQALAARLLEGQDLCKSDHLVVSHFHSLCRLRAEQVRSPHADVEVKAVLPDAPHSVDQREKLERNGYVYANGNVIPGHVMAGMRIRMLVPRVCPADTRWSVIRASELEFVVPDSFGAIGVVPLSPQACLVANSAGSGRITAENVRAMNEVAIAQAHRYYLARSFAACGLQQSAA